MTIADVRTRVFLLNLVTALLIAGGVLLLLAWAAPATNLTTTLVALTIAILHLVGALGTALRRAWGRIIGLVVAWIGVFGSGAVVVSLVPALPSLLIGSAPGAGSWLGALAITTALLVGYLTVLIVLLNNRASFEPGPGHQLG